MVYEDAIASDPASDMKTVTTDDTTYQVRTMIIATGSGCRTLDAPDEAEHLGHGVFCCATCDGFFSKGQLIIVAGGEDSAMEEATYLTNFGSSVILVHCCEGFHTLEAIQQRALSDPRVRFKLNRMVDSIDSTDKVETVTLRDTVTGETKTIEVGGLFVATGHVLRTELVRDQLHLDDLGNIRVDPPTTRTSLPGVFAAGDVTDALYRQTVTSVGTGCRAVIDTERYLKDLEA